MQKVEHGFERQYGPQRKATHPGATRPFTLGSPDRLGQEAALAEAGVANDDDGTTSSRH
jgi:hypothetical protein